MNTFERALEIAESYYRPESIYNSVLVKMPGVGRMRTLKLHRNKDGNLYVRIGRRGSCKVCLKDMRRADVIDATGTPVFYE